MNYKGVELQPINECKVFEEPREMLVWNESYTRPIEKLVCAVIPYRREGSVITRGGAFEYCAEIPEEPKPRRATWKELAYWLMDGKGLVVDENTSRVDTGIFFNRVDLDAEVSDNLKVMRRDDTDWHEPTVNYLGLEI